MFHNGLKWRTYIASGDLSLCYHHIVEALAANFVCDIAPAGKGIGILMNAPRAGEGASVAYEGECEVRAGSAIAAGDYITSAGSGWACSVSSTTNQVQLGRAITGCASGMLAVVDLNVVKAPTA